MNHPYEAIFENVYLRPLAENDIEQLRMWRNNTTNTKFLRQVGEITPKMQKQWYQKYLQNNDELIFAIDEIHHLHRLVGSVSLYNFKNNSAEIGKILIGDPDAHGRGMGRKSFIIALLIGFQCLGLTKITCSVHPDNISAYRSYTKIGFQIIGEHPSPTGEGLEKELEITPKQLFTTNPFISDIIIKKS